MTKRILALLFSLLLSMSAWAAVDVNKATQADLETVKGIGPAIAGKIMDERKKGAFKDWPDLIERVKGIGEANAGKFSTNGLTVGGAAYNGAAPAAATAKAPAKGASKPAAKAEAAAPAPAPAAASKPTKEEAKKAKADAKAAKAEAAAASGPAKK
jgi:competence protein ComEA